MKQLIITLFLFHSLFSYGQFAIVSGSKGWVHIYRDEKVNSEIIDSLKNGHLLYCYKQEGDRASIDYKKGSREAGGYIEKGRYTFLSKFWCIPLVLNSGNAVTFKKDTIEIRLTQRKFEKSKHKFTYTEGHWIVEIDNKKFWGTDGEMPVTQYDKISIRMGKIMITLPDKALDGLYQPSLYTAKVNFDKKKNILYIQSMNSDGAGAYEVVWKVENGVYKERLIAYGF